MGRDLSPGDGPLLRRHPIEIENVGVAPGCIRGREQVAEDFDGLEMKVEERVERPGRQFFPVDHGQARKTLRPKQIHYPNVSDKLLYVVRPADIAWQFEQSGVGVEVRLPIVG